MINRLPSFLKVFSVIIMLVLHGGLAGCSSLPFTGKGEDDKEPEPPGIVSLHQVVPEQLEIGTLAMEMESPESGRTFKVRKMPFLSSMFFPAVKFEQETTADTKVMVAALDSRGKIRWMQGCVELRGHYVAVLVDGEYEFLWRVPRPSEADSNFLRIHGPWDDETAERISSNAVNNYTELNYK